jgi:integrase
MPRRSGKVPSYCRHKRSGQAVVRIGHRDHYLGPYGSPESHEHYERLIAEWRASRSVRSSGPQSSPTITARATVSEVLLAYAAFAKDYYVKDGLPTGELENMRDALRPLRQLYGSTLASEFGPKRLKALQQKLIADGLSRGVVNARISRIKRFFRWAVAEELIPASVYHGLQAVNGLSFGRTNAHETEPIRPVPDAWVDATLPFLSPQVAAMVQLQRLAGMRPCEVVLMRASDIDMSGDVWIFEPPVHKNRWRGDRRQVAIGPQAQAIVQQFLKLDLSAYLFSPREAEAERNRLRRLARESKLTPSQAARRPKAQPQRAKRERYDTASFRRAICYGIKKANKTRGEADAIPNWCPLQLRHSHATDVRREFGVEAAQVSLGHARADVTQIYAERNQALAIPAFAGHSLQRFANHLIRCKLLAESHFEAVFRFGRSRSTSWGSQVRALYRPLPATLAEVKGRITREWSAVQSQLARSIREAEILADVRRNADLFDTAVSAVVPEEPSLAIEDRRWLVHGIRVPAAWRWTDDWIGWMPLPIVDSVT